MSCYSLRSIIFAKRTLVCVNLLVRSNVAKLALVRNESIYLLASLLSWFSLLAGLLIASLPFIVSNCFATKCMRDVARSNERAAEAVSGSRETTRILESDVENRD